MMTPDELYAFDLNGFLLIEDAIAPDILDEANAIADEFERRANLGAFEGEGEPARANKPRHTVRFSRIVNEHEVFLRIAMSPKVVRCLPDLIVGPKLKSTWLDFKEKGGGIGYHANHTPYNPVDAYHFHHRIHANLITVMYALRDVPEDGAALDVIPGSHKANYPLPTDPALLARLRRKLPVKAGSALMFSHDVNHGSTQTRDYVRRAVFTSFGPGFSAHTQGEEDLYDDAFARAPENSWAKYLLRRPKGDDRGYPMPTHPPEEDAALNGRLAFA